MCVCVSEKKRETESVHMCTYNTMSTWTLTLLWKLFLLDWATDFSMSHYGYLGRNTVDLGQDVLVKGKNILGDKGEGWGVMVEAGEAFAWVLTF
jgi:hypothetical protein